MSHVSLQSQFLPRPGLGQRRPGLLGSYVGAISHCQSSVTFLYPFSEHVNPPQQDNGCNVHQDKVVGGVDS